MSTPRGAHCRGLQPLRESQLVHCALAEATNPESTDRPACTLQHPLVATALQTGTTATAEHMALGLVATTVAEGPDVVSCL
jgi:hypothetical protein